MEPWTKSTFARYYGVTLTFDKVHATKPHPQPHERPVMGMELRKVPGGKDGTVAALNDVSPDQLKSAIEDALKA